MSAPRRLLRLFDLPLPRAGGLRLGALIAGCYDRFHRDRLAIHASAASYASFVAAVPLLTLLLTLLGLFHAQGLVRDAFAGADGVLPPALLELLEQTLLALARSRAHLSLTAGAVASALLILWGAGSIARVLMSGFTLAAGRREQRRWYRRWLRSLWLSLACASLVGSAFTLVVLGPELLDRGAGLVGLPLPSPALLAWLRWPLIWLLVLLSLALLHRFAPAGGGRLRPFSHGALFTTAAWTGLSWAVIHGVGRIGATSAAWGSLAGVIALLVYAWWTTLFVLLGAEVDAVIAEARSGAGRDDRRRPIPPAAPVADPPAEQPADPPVE